MQPTKVPTLPAATDVRRTVKAIEEGLNFLRGLATALERVEASASIAIAEVENDVRVEAD